MRKKIQQKPEMKSVSPGELYKGIAYSKRDFGR